MESDLRSSISLPRHEDVLEDMVEIKKDLHNQIVRSIRNVVGSVQGLEDDQIYPNFKSTLMELHVSLRPKESSWPIAFLNVFMPNLVN